MAFLPACDDGRTCTYTCIHECSLVICIVDRVDDKVNIHDGGVVCRDASPRCMLCRADAKHVESCFSADEGRYKRDLQKRSITIASVEYHNSAVEYL